jgi:hypothetical protein
MKSLGRPDIADVRPGKPVFRNSCHAILAAQKGPKIRVYQNNTEIIKTLAE